MLALFLLLANLAHLSEGLGGFQRLKTMEREKEEENRRLREAAKQARSDQLEGASANDPIRPGAQDWPGEEGGQKANPDGVANRFMTAIKSALY